MRSNTKLARQIIVVFFVMLGMLHSQAESTTEKLSKALSSGGTKSLVFLINQDALEAPLITSGDVRNKDQAAQKFGRELLHQINITASSETDLPNLDSIAVLLKIGEWLKGRTGYGNLIVSHRAFDAAGALTLKKLNGSDLPSQELLILAERAANTVIEPIFRAHILDGELQSTVFTDQLLLVSESQREQVIRKLWKNLCFLHYSEKNPSTDQNFDQMRRPILQSLGKQSAPFLTLAKTAPTHLLTPQTLEEKSKELLESQNLWFVSMASAPANLQELSYALQYLKTAGQFPKTVMGATKDAIKKNFVAQWNDAKAGENLAIPNRVAEIFYRVQSGEPLDRESRIIEMQNHKEL